MRILNLGIAAKYYPQADPCEGRLVILGGARCVWEDYEKIRKKHDVMCVNDVVMHFDKPIRHFYSNDVKMIPKWIAARRPKWTRHGDPLIHCWQPGFIHWPWPGSGTSSLQAVYTGLALGYDEITLCGIPLDDSGHYFDPPWVESNFTREVPYKGNGTLRYWVDAKEKVFENRVRSMSGRTKALLNP